MRSRNNTADPAADPSKLPFQLGNLVLCRYSSYPYWPATIDVSHQKNQKGRYVRWSNTDPNLLLFWCTFSNEDSGGWVPSTRIALYHPDHAQRIRVPEDHDDYESQADAIRVAEEFYQMLKRDEGPQSVPPAPSDLLAGKTEFSDDDQGEGDNDLDENENEKDQHHQQKQESPKQQPKSPTLRKSSSKRRKSSDAPTTVKKEPTPTRPRAKKEPRKTKRKSAPTVSPRASKKPKTAPKPERRRALAKKEPAAMPPPQQIQVDEEEEEPVSRGRRSSRPGDDSWSGAAAAKIAELERSLEAANSTISKVKRTLRKKENQLAELTNGSSPFHVKHPPQPEVAEMPLPNTSQYRSQPMDSDTFSHAITELRSQYDVFTESVRTASSTRVMLEDECKLAQEKIGNLIDRVVDTEKTAAGNETQLAAMLSKILVADISVADLRTHKAGNLLKAMTKKCKDMQLIFDYSSAIYETWMSQVMNHMSTGDKKKSKGEPSTDKSAPGAGEVENGNGPNATDKDETKQDPEKDEKAEKDKDSAANKKGTTKDAEMTDVKEGEETPATEQEDRQAGKSTTAGKKGPRDESNTDSNEGKDGSNNPTKNDDNSGDRMAVDSEKMGDAEKGNGKSNEGTYQIEGRKGAHASTKSDAKDTKAKDSAEKGGAKAGSKADKKGLKNRATDTPRSVTVPADPTEGKSKQPADSSKKGDDGKHTTSNVQKDASGKLAAARDVPEQKLPPSAKEKEKTVS